MKVASIHRPKLNAAQRALVRGAPDVAEKAAGHVIRHYGDVLPYDELVSIGHLACALAAQTYDPEHAASVPFSQWAFFRSVEAMIDDGRVEIRHRKLKSVLRAGVRYASMARTPERDPFQETDETAMGDLVALLEGSLVAMIDAANADPEAQAIDKGEQERVGGALKKVVSDLDAADREVLELRFADDLQIKAIAEQKRTSYWKLRRRHIDVLDKMRRRLTSHGVTKTPETPLQSVLESHHRPR